MYSPQKFEDRLLGTPGFSDVLLTTHFKLYEGYVKNINLILETLQKMNQEGKMEGPGFAELKRRMGWEFNGMRLHEDYFWNMTKTAQEKDAALDLIHALEKEFGSYDAWLNDFMATGVMRGIGWVILYFDPLAGKLVNAWVEEHALGHFAGCIPLVVMDVFEHAYMPDYQTDRKGYIDAFFKQLDWKIVGERYNAVVKFVGNTKA
jgi:Fe-Mn family superoxide dismutase